MPNELSEKVYPDGTVVKLRDDTAREQISQLNDEIAKQSVTVTKTSAVTSNSGIVVYICNNFCFVTMDVNILSGAADGTVLATGFTKPTNFVAIGRTTKAFDIVINSSGELIIKGTPTTGWVQGSISYMI